MSNRYANQKCWWERENVPWTGEVFDRFNLKEDNFRTRRVQKLRQEIIDGTMGKRGILSIDRAKLFTDSYKQTEGEPAIIRRAKAHRHVLENIPIYFPEDQLLVGYPSSKRNGVEIEPEYHAAFLDSEVEINGQIMREIDSLPIRKFIEFYVDEDEKKYLEDVILPYWKDKTLHHAAIKQLERHKPEAISYWQDSFTSFPVTRIGLCHTIQEYKTVVYKGLRFFRDEILEEKAKLKINNLNDYENISKMDHYDAMLITLEGVISYAHRCADLVEQRAVKEKNPERKEELIQMAKNCRNVPENPAETWWEAMQSLHFVHMITWLTDAGVSHSLGRMDVYMNEILEKDLANGLTMDKAQELLECFMVTFCYRNQLVDWRGSKATPGWHTNDKITIGGVDDYGNDSTNRLSYMILEGHAHIHLNDPIISARIHNDTPYEFLKAIMQVLRTSGGVPQLIFDNAIISNLMGELGMPLKEARNYADVGCQENQSDPNSYLNSDTNGHQNAGYFNLVKPIELALHNGVNPRNGKQVGPKTGDPRTFKTMDEMAEAVRKQFEYAIDMNVIINNVIEYCFTTYVPTPYHNLMHPGPRHSGIDINSGSCKYNYTGAIGTGIGTAEDSMAAIDKIVFIDKTATMDELIDALDNNWEGYDELRAACIAVPKYGMDNDFADKWGKFISDTFMDAYESHPTIRGGKYQVGYFSVTQNHVLGEDTDATPDGRKAKEMLSDSTSPSPYAVPMGPTASHRSYVKVMDTSRTVNGITFAQSMDLNGLMTDRELSKWGDFIQTFSREGGQSVQYNVLSAEQLKDARIHPELHNDLFIRIGGYTARFIDLSEKMQISVVEKAIQRC